MKLSFLLFLAAVAGGQTVPQFDVASVKPGDPAVLRGSLEYRPEAGKFSANSATLAMLIGFAYDVRSHQISGGPGWRDTATFTIEAKADRAIPTGPDGTQMFRVMLQSLLAERFQLVAHRETREEPRYELVVNKGGPKLKEGTEAKGGIRMATGQITGTATPMFLLVNQLSRQLGRTVVDKTGLTGRYDFTLKWGPDGSELEPSIFTAMQEDLGLRLQSAKGPVEIVVIDGVEKPAAN